MVPSISSVSATSMTIANTGMRWGSYTADSANSSVLYWNYAGCSINGDIYYIG